MPWIEEEIQHAKFLDTLWWKILRRYKDPQGNYWWPDFNEHVDKVDLYKISFERGMLVNKGGRFHPSVREATGNVCITRHMIMRRWDNEFLGIAQSTGSIQVSSKEFPEDQQDLMRWFVNLYKDSIDYTTFYAYTMDHYDGYTHFLDESNKPAPVTILNHDYGKGVLLSSLDIEFYHDSLHFKNTMQSPIITLKLYEGGGVFNSVGKFNFRTNTNWWDDSIIRVKGNITEEGMFFVLQADSAPTWQNNSVVTVPFFFGNLINPDIEDNMIGMFGGSQAPFDFDYDSIQDTTAVLQPITRNYVHYPSNGIDSIMVKKTKYGARYQSHYLRWNAPPNEIPPTRFDTRDDGIRRKYPRAWNYLREGYYNYDFHPSRYSDKIHASRAYVIHPEDGVVGYIPNIILTPAIHLSEGEILQLPHYCVKCEEEYVHPVPEEPDLPDWEIPLEAGFCQKFTPAKTIEEAEDFAQNCLHATPVNYRQSLEWANFFNEGLWRLLKDFPSIRKLIKENHVELYLDSSPSSPTTLGYFSTPTQNRPMRIALITSRSLADYRILIQASYASGFLASPDYFHLINHEMGHYCHYNSVSEQRWTEISSIDADGYGEQTPLNAEDLEYIETKLSEYAHFWFPIELVAETFALLTLGYQVDSKIMEWYEQYDGFIPHELEKEKMIRNYSRSA